jgi:hypothetical protein
MGPKAGLDDMARTKSLPLPGLEVQPLGHPALGIVKGENVPVLN